MTNNDEIIDCYCFQAAADATWEAVLQELAEEAMITGGAVWTFGPDGSDQLYPPASRSRSRR